MPARLNIDKIAQLMLPLLLLGASGVADGGNVPDWKSETFSLVRAGEVSLPLRITPVLVEAPPRRVDLFPSPAEAGRAHGASLPLTGLPVDLYEYPVLKFSATGQESGPHGLELGLDTRDTGAIDTLVRVGDPVLFPDMIGERSDFRSAEFAAKDLGYKIKRTLGIGGDGKWRYTAINSKVDGITNGIVSASFEPGGALVLQRVFASPELSKTPWLRYEYELPKGLAWVMQIAARIDRGGLSPKLTRLLSEPVMGGGKKKLLVNLYDLLQKADPDAKDGRLEELIIHFHLDGTAGAAAQNVRIDLGRLELYQAQTVGSRNAPQSFLLATEGAFEGTVNLRERLESRLGPLNEWTVLSGRLVSARQNSPGMPEIPPKISLHETYREKIPELFAGERFFLDELSGDELSAVLDQRMFVEKQVLWESGRSDVVFLKPGEFHPMPVAVPLVSYAQDTRIEGDAYIKADYSFEGAGQFPLYLTLSGTDKYGRQVESDYLLLKNRPLKVRDIQIRKITLSFRQEGGSSLPIPAFCIIKNIQISSFKKTTVYRPKPAVAHVALDGSAIPAGKLVWRANPERFNIGLREGEDFQTVQTFPVEAKMVGDAVVKFDLEPASGGNLVFFLRMRGSDERGYFEKLFPLSRRGEVRVPNMALHGLDIVVKGDATQASAPVAVTLNQLEVRYRGEGSHGQNEPLKRKSLESSEIAYLALHMPLHDPALVWLRPAYAAESAQPDLTEMSKLDATLTYAEILGGGKNIVLPETFLGRGEHALNYVADEDVRVTIDQSFLKLNRAQQTAAAIKAEAEKAAPSKLAKIGLLILAGGLVLLGVKFMPRWAPLMDRTLAWEPAFWGIQFVLLGAALYMMFVNADKDAFSWGGLLLLFAYGLAVRYKIRSYLVQKWDFFRQRHSAPYFLLFLAVLLSIAVMLMFKLGLAAEHAAVIGYYLLVTGVVIEFIRFAKESKIAKQNELLTASTPAQ